VPYDVQIVNHIFQYVMKESKNSYEPFREKGSTYAARGSISESIEIEYHTSMRELREVTESLSFSPARDPAAGEFRNVWVLGASFSKHSWTLWFSSYIIRCSQPGARSIALRRVG
jgi:hypothetical protein